MSIISYPSAVQRCALTVIVALLLSACGGTAHIPEVTSVALVAPTAPLVPRAAANTAPAATSAPAVPATAFPAAPTVAPATPTIDVALAAIAQRNHVPVLCYHAVRDWTAADDVANRPYIVPIKAFNEQLDFLAHAAYHTISPDQLTAYLTHGTPLPAKPILLTFDDGDGTQWTNVLPALRKHQFTATFFVMTIVLDHPGYLSSQQVQELDRDGMTIGAHTWDHHRVTRYTGNDWDTQITKPTAQLQKLVGHPIKYFAYPYGLWDATAINHIQEAGFVAAFQLKDAASPTAPMFTIRRMIGNALWTDARFKQALSIDF